MELTTPGLAHEAERRSTSGPTATGCLGYLLARFDTDIDIEALRSVLAIQPRADDSLLDPRAPLRGERVQTWNVLVNATVEPDL